MPVLREIITATDPEVRNQSLDAFCRAAGAAELLEEAASLEAFRQGAENLYERVRALFFLYAIHRFHLPFKAGVRASSLIPWRGYESVLQRRFEEAVECFLGAQEKEGPSGSLSSALAAAYQRLGFQTLADQVRRSVRSVRGNQWMFRTGHPLDYPLKIRPELLKRAPQGLFPVLRETTPVRMDLTHSGWSDIFFLGMDYPEGARVLNVSIDLSVRQPDGGGIPQPPVEAYLRVIDRPVLRLVSVDLQTVAEITSLAEVFDYAKDYLGLLKAAVVASGIVPPGMEGAHQPLGALLERLTGHAGYGLELISKVNDIPKGSRLAVSTTLLASLVTVCMRATNQTRALSGGLEESDRRLVAARAILGEWLGGSGGGWQDSGGVWPSIKLICGELAKEGDPEYGISRGCLLPRHRIFSREEITEATRRGLQDSLVLVHGGMAQDVGPILEMVTEKYLLRSEKEWQGRQEAIRILDEIVEHLRRGDIRAIGEATHRNFTGPIQTIIPWASNLYTERLIERVQAEFGAHFWGFWMLGGMAGGGMGFLFDPRRKAEAQARLGGLMGEVKRSLERAAPFAMEPVVYNFAINERGTQAELREATEALLPAGYYTLSVPAWLRKEAREWTPAQRAELDLLGAACRRDPSLAGLVQSLFEHLLPRSSGEAGSGSQSLEALLAAHGFDRHQHEQIQANLRSGRIGLGQNRLPVSAKIEDVRAGDVVEATKGLPEDLYQRGMEALREGAVVVVTLAGGIGTRWTKGAGVVKALNPFCKLAGKHRSFLEVHFAKSRRVSRMCGMAIPHVVTTSYLTHDAVAEALAAHDNYGYEGGVYLSPGRSVGLRMVPMVRDLRFAWEEMPQQLLDDQQQKVRESLHATLIHWAQQAGEGSDYTDNVPLQCLHPVGHWFEIPNMLRNGVLRKLLAEHPQLRCLMMHNVDTTGVDVAPELLGLHLESGKAMTVEVITRYVEDRGGGLARVDGKLRLVEGLALPSEEVEFDLTYYNSNTMWIDIPQLLEVFGLSAGDLEDEEKVAGAVRNLAARMPTYITLKDVKKRWGKGQEDIFPVAQWEKLWGDMTTLAEYSCQFVEVSRLRGQQLKEVAQLDGWLRDGSAAWVESRCEFA